MIAKRSPIGETLSDLTAPSLNLANEQQFEMPFVMGCPRKKTVDLLDPAFVQIQSIILQEIEDPTAAQSIAHKVLDYECNEAYQRQVAEREHARQDGFVDRDAVQQHLADSHAQSLMAGQFSRKLEKLGLNPSEKAEAKVVLESLRLLVKISNQKAFLAVRDGVRKKPKCTATTNAQATNSLRQSSRRPKDSTSFFH